MKNTGKTAGDTGAGVKGWHISTLVTEIPEGQERREQKQCLKTFQN